MLYFGGIWKGGRKFNFVNICKSIWKDPLMMCSLNNINQDSILLLNLISRLGNIYTHYGKQII